MRIKIGILAVLLCLTGCTDSADKGEEDASTTDSSDTEETSGETSGETGDECPGGMGESACCEEGTTLCGTSLTGEECCESESEYCATCYEQGEEFTTCLSVGEECEDPGEKN